MHVPQNQHCNAAFWDDSKFIKLDQGSNFARPLFQVGTDFGVIIARTGRDTTDT